MKNVFQFLRPPVPRSHPLKHLGHQLTKLRGPGLSLKISGELLHPTRIRPEGTMGSEHPFSCTTGVAAAAAAIVATGDTDHGDSDHGEPEHGEPDKGDAGQLDARREYHHGNTFL